MPELPLVLTRWLAEFAGFPGARLPPKAELLLCVAVSAAVEEQVASASGSPLSFGIQRREGNKDSALRAHALRRSQAHFRCDNSAKV